MYAPIRPVSASGIESLRSAWLMSNTARWAGLGAAAFLALTVPWLGQNNTFWLDGEVLGVVMLTAFAIPAFGFCLYWMIAGQTLPIIDGQGISYLARSPFSLRSIKRAPWHEIERIVLTPHSSGGDRVGIQSNLSALGLEVKIQGAGEIRWLFLGPTLHGDKDLREVSAEIERLASMDRRIEVRRPV